MPLHQTIRTLCVFMVLISARAMADCPERLTVGWESWEPFMYLNREGQLTGLDIELARAIGVVMKCNLVFIEIPFKRHLLELKRGKIDVASSVQYTAERAEFARYSNAYRSSGMHLIIRAGERKRYPFKSLEDVARSTLVLGSTTGYFYGNEVNALLARTDTAITHEAVLSDEQNVRKLIANRIDAFLGDPVVAFRVAQRFGLSKQIEVHPLPVHSTTFYLIGSKLSVSEATMDSINMALEELEANGALRGILQQYMPPVDIHNPN
ncbi:MAG: transporter substrate-binding domain-containing protein [Pseudomonadales bacterium]|nr:transporter substrate-binding domain-containing protein [Pseudomonadales bacterium]